MFFAKLTKKRFAPYQKFHGDFSIRELYIGLQTAYKRVALCLALSICIDAWPGCWRVHQLYCSPPFSYDGDEVAGCRTCGLLTVHPTVRAPVQRQVNGDKVAGCRTSGLLTVHPTVRAPVQWGQGRRVQNLWAFDRAPKGESACTKTSQRGQGRRV